LYKWLLPTITEVLAAADAEINADLNPVCALTWDGDVDCPTNPSTEDRQVKAQRQWYGAIAALSRLLASELATLDTQNGHLFNQKLTRDVPQVSVNPLLLCSALPVDLSPEFSSHFGVWKFISEAQLSPKNQIGDRRESEPIATVRLLTNDPLSEDQFCLLLTPRLSLVMGIGSDATGEPVFHFSFDPKVVDLAAKTLRSRITLTGSPEMASAIDCYFEQLTPVAPDYQTVMRFSQLCLKYQPDLADVPTTSRSKHKPFKLLTASSTPVESSSQHPYRLAEKIQPKSRGIKSDRVDTSMKPVSNHVTSIDSSTPKLILEKLAGTAEKIGDKNVLNQPPGLDVELLQAIAHEVRTPLSTIRTLTRLLLKRRNLDKDIIKRLETIDRECSEQIDRFSLIFRAVELETCETTRSLLQLTSTSLADVFSHCIPRWQKQASRRNLTLDVIVPPKMPPVVTDPTMLDQVLTGAIENFISSVPGGSEVQVKVMLAGHQLKMQLHSEIKENQWDANSATTPPLKSIGQLLMFQPETGNISLNLSTTKNLFHALGGKLIVRKRSQQGQVLTIFLPLEA